MRNQALICMAVVLGLASIANPQNFADVKITFQHPPDAPPPFDGGLSHDAWYPKDTAGQPPKLFGSFADLLATNIATIHVAWSNSTHLKDDAESESLLRDLLTSKNTTHYRWHVWSSAEVQPSIIASVEHRNGQPGRWVIWCQPDLHWAYEEGNGIWWWGVSPNSCATSAAAK